MRPTWHFVSPADIRWLLDLTAPRIRQAMAYHNRRLELDEAVFGRTNAVLAEALQGGRQLTRDELAAALRQESAFTAYLFPDYDEYTVGYADHSIIFDAAHASKLSPREGLLANTMALDGQIVGHWKRTFKKNAVVIEANPFVALSSEATRLFTHAASRYAQFLQMPVVSPFEDAPFT